MAETNKKDIKTRNWTFIIYPESAPANWKELLSTSGLAYAISPLHDKDTNDDGTPKKPHYHIVVVYDNTTTYKNVEDFTKQFNGTIPQRCKSLKGSLRYFTHKDNPEKYQYTEEGIITSRIDYKSLVQSLTASDRHTIIKEMIKYIKDNQVTEFIDFADYCMEERFDDWFSVLCDSSVLIIKECIKSNHWKLRGYIRREE